MLPVILLVALLVLTWVAAVVASFIEPNEPPDGAAADEPSDRDYIDAA